MKEVWRRVARTKYEVSNFGRVRNGLLILKGSIDSCGYRQVSVRKKLKNLGGLVASAFLGPSDLQVNHIDGNKLNNRLTNLEYVTPSQNIRHAFSIGLRTSLGAQHNRTFLTNLDVQFIRDIYRNKALSQVELSKIYGLHFSTISKIVTRANWGHLCL